MKKCLIFIFILFFCGLPKEQEKSDSWYLTIGKNEIEVVYDQFGNAYMKQYIRLDKKVWIYIPFKGQFEAETNNDIIQYTGAAVKKVSYRNVIR